MKGFGLTVLIGQILTLAVTSSCSKPNPLEVASQMEVFKKKELPENCKAQVYFFLQPDCPLSQNYTKPLAELASDTRFENFCFTGFFSGKLYSRDEFEYFILHYDTPYRVSLDPDLKMASALGATVVPEVFVVNPSGETVYSGAIDDWAVREGGKGRAAKQYYLEDVLVALREGKLPSIRKTEAVGCVLE